MEPGAEVVSCVEDGEEGEAPANAVDCDPVALVEELVDDVAQELEVDQSPNGERPCCGRQVGLSDVAVCALLVGQDDEQDRPLERD